MVKGFDVGDTGGESVGREIQCGRHWWEECWTRDSKWEALVGRVLDEVFDVEGTGRESAGRGIRCGRHWWEEYWMRDSM